MTKTPKTYTDPMGMTIPAKYVKPYDKQRDAIARKIYTMWENEEKRLRDLKEKSQELIEEMRLLSEKETDAKTLGTGKGNLTFRSFDGSITIQLDCQKHTEFDERLSLAQQLIMEAVKELSAGAESSDLAEIARRAFQPRRSGNLDMARIRELRTYNVKHPKWIKACEIIADCERVIGSRQYIRVARRNAPDATPENILLDIAKV